MSVSNSLTDAYLRSERNRKCKERNGGEHLWGEWSDWKHSYRLKQGRIVGSYEKRIRVCKDCKARSREVKST